MEPFTAVEPANSTAVAQSNTTSPSPGDPLSSSKEMKKCLQLITEILSVSEQSLANVLEKFHSLLHGVCTLSVCVCVFVSLCNVVYC